MRDFNHPKFVEATVGTSGIGKTSAFLARLKALGARWKFIFDHKYEFAKKLKQPVCKTYEDLCKATARRGFVLFNHGTMFPGDSAAGLRFFCDFVYNIADLDEMKGRKVLVVDEVQKHTETMSAPDELIACLDDGRSKQIDAMLISQSLNGIHNRIRNQISEIFVFRQSDDNAIEPLARMGFDADTIRSLRPGEWLWRNLDTGADAHGGNAFKIKNSGIPAGAHGPTFRQVPKDEMEKKIKDRPAPRWIKRRDDMPDATKAAS